MKNFFLTLTLAFAFVGALISTKEEFHKALGGLFKQENIPKDIMWFRPKHFLANIETYIDASNNNKYTLYK